MASWIFWTMYGLIGYTMISLTFIIVTRSAWMFAFEMWRGRKMLVFFKRGNVITDYRLLKEEPVLGLKKGEKTYSVDERKGIRFKRLPVHIFDENNIAELDFSDKTNIYPPYKFDPAVYQKAIKRALASGVNDSPLQVWIIAGVIVLVLLILAVFSGYIDYQTYVMIRDQVLKGVSMKI